MFLLPEVRLHLGVREVRFYLGNPVRRKHKWVYFYKHVNESICGDIRRNSQSLLSGQGVRAVHPFQEVPENRERERWIRTNDWIMTMNEKLLVLTSHTGGPLGPGNPAGPCGPNEPYKSITEIDVKSLSEAITNNRYFGRIQLLFIPYPFTGWSWGAIASWVALWRWGGEENEKRKETEGN